VIQAPKLLGLEIMRYELTDHEWTAIKPMLPSKPRGVPRVNDRRAQREPGISRFPGAQLRTWGLVLRTIPE
jgi:transposase